ncbi:hypothetical protein C8J57DRAFT_1603717 [Mycena rebaudengoi]|nr:hypothetical protein C8J57DRAFT_1603717 [Mycena rebaudengoi]
MKSRRAGGEGDQRHSLRLRARRKRRRTRRTASGKRGCPGAQGARGEGEGREGAATNKRAAVTSPTPRRLWVEPARCGAADDKRRNKPTPVPVPAIAPPLSPPVQLAAARHIVPQQQQQQQQQQHLYGLGTRGGGGDPGIWHVRLDSRFLEIARHASNCNSSNSHSSPPTSRGFPPSSASMNSVNSVPPRHASLPLASPFGPPPKQPQLAPGRRASLKAGPITRPSRTAAWAVAGRDRRRPRFARQAAARALFVREDSSSFKARRHHSTKSARAIAHYVAPETTAPFRNQVKPPFKTPQVEAFAGPVSSKSTRPLVVKPIRKTKLRSPNFCASATAPSFFLDILSER